jgi:hypothetical protein
MLEASVETAPGASKGPSRVVAAQTKVPVGAASHDVNVGVALTIILPIADRTKLEAASLL